MHYLQKINQAIVKDDYPTPFIDDVLHRLQNAEMFSSYLNSFFPCRWFRSKH